MFPLLYFPMIMVILLLLGLTCLTKPSFMSHIEIHSVLIININH